MFLCGSVRLLWRNRPFVFAVQKSVCATFRRFYAYNNAAPCGGPEHCVCPVSDCLRPGKHNATAGIPTLCGDRRGKRRAGTVTVINYDEAGREVSCIYTKAPERVVAVYQGSIETMIALGLEDHVVASYGLDNAVKEEWQEGFSQMHYHDDVFAPDKETVTLLQPDMILSWGSLFSDKMLGGVSGWQEKGVATYMNSNTRPGDHPRTLENEYTDILNLGTVFDVEDRARHSWRK